MGFQAFYCQEPPNIMIYNIQTVLSLACKVDHWPQDHPTVVRVCDKHLTLRTHSVNNDAIGDRAQVCQLFIQGRKGESLL